MDLTLQLEVLKDKLGYFSSRKIAKISSNLKTQIDNYLDTIEFQSLKTIEKIYWIVNDFKEYPIKCKKCKKDITNFRSIKDGYSGEFCSRSCQQTYKFDIIGRKEKIKLTNEQKQENKLTQQKAREQTFLKKYGCRTPFHSGIISDKRVQNNLKKYVKQRITELQDRFTPLFSVEEYVGSKTKYKWLCNTCKTEFEEDLANGMDPVCPTCYTPTASKAQHEIADYIKSLEFTIRLNDRSLLKNREIDILVNDVDFGIEYNGLYWHSEKSKVFSKTHLRDKMELVNSYGIKLINIFEDEWINQQEIVKSIISNNLKKNIRIFARKCEIKEVDFKIASDFLNNYHLQGEDVSFKRYGLYYENELVSLMTFCKPRFDRKSEWELSRFCSKNFTNIIGGASKLFKHFLRVVKPTNIISYADLRYGTGNVYSNLGFQKTVENTGLNYFYIKNNKMGRLSRYKCQKHKLRKMLDNFDENLTESKNMENNGYYRIWDCGNSKWTWNSINT